MKEIELKDVELIVREVFPKANFNVPLQDLKLGDIEEWDSLGNFNLLLAFEEFYGFRFSIDDMADLKSIANIITAIQRK
jgi:acyl carrier protein